MLDGMKASKLFRADQYTYLLYPNKDLPGFIAKNRISAASVAKSELLQQLVESSDTSLIEKDVKGHYHFNGNFRNNEDVKNALANLATSDLADLAKKDGDLILQIFEEVFNHKAFTGRSGTFFGFEGLGSTYWHMVSKHLLAVQECCLAAIRSNDDAATIGRLLDHYYEINAGIGVHKSPDLYGAFPTDAYSHTPYRRGAQQPGMTGQVKEDILCRFGELGVYVKNGQLYFHPTLLRQSEFLTEAKTFDYVDVNGNLKQLELGVGSLSFTYCQVPIIYQIADDNGIVVHENDDTTTINALSLDEAMSEKVFGRTDVIDKIVVNLKASMLR